MDTRALRSHTCIAGSIAGTTAMSITLQTPVPRKMAAASSNEDEFWEAALEYKRKRELKVRRKTEEKEHQIIAKVAKGYADGLEELPSELSIKNCKAALQVKKTPVADAWSSTDTDSLTSLRTPSRPGAILSHLVDLVPTLHHRHARYDAVDAAGRLAFIAGIPTAPEPTPTETRLINHATRQIDEAEWVRVAKVSAAWDTHERSGRSTEF